MQIRIGVANAAKELEFAVEDGSAVVESYNSAMKNDELMFTIEERDGAMTVLAVGAILYISLDAPMRPGIGFAVEG